MAETIDGAIEKLRTEIAVHRQQMCDKMRTINTLCGLVGREPMFSATDLDDSSSASPVTRDAYYGQDIADVIEDILRRRKAAGKGAATVNEIYEAMQSGGFRFSAKSDDNAKRGLYISLGKNPKFHKVPDGSYGLTAWYPAIKAAKQKNGGTEKTEDGAATDVPDLDAADLDLSGVFDSAEAEPAIVGAAGDADEPAERPKKPR